jgi:hypothetical protein
MKTLAERLLDWCLVRAVNRNSEEKVKTLLEEGADPDTKNLHGIPVMVIAIKSGHIGITDLLLSHGACREDRSGRWLSVVMVAEECLRRAREIVDLLQEQRSSPQGGQHAEA